MDDTANPRVVVAGRILLVVLWLVTWEIVGRFNPQLISHPTLVLSTLFDMIGNGELGRLVGNSARIFFLGWLFAVAMGLLIGMFVGWFRPALLMFEPFLNALYSTPLIALIPLMVLWFGLSVKALVVSVIINAIFPMIIMAIVGSRNAAREYIEVARSFRLGTIGMLVKVVLPGAWPYLLVGLRLTTSSALRGTIFAGFLIPDNGLGNALRSAGDALATNRLYGLIIVVVVLALLVDFLLRRGVSLTDYTR